MVSVLIADVEVADAAELDYKERRINLQFAGDHGLGRWLAVHDGDGIEERS
jgi:hypothetical protein